MTPDDALPEDPNSGTGGSRPDRVWRPDPLSSGWRGPARRRRAGSAPGPGGQPDGSGASTGGDSGNAGWMIFGYLISGMAFYGALGWLIGHLAGLSWVFPVGMLFGIGTGITLVVLKYGRG